MNKISVLKGWALSCVAVMMLMLQGCAENEYSTKYYCRFTFYSDKHAGNLIEMSLGSVSEFVMVSRYLTTPNYIYAVTNTKDEKIYITTEIESNALKNSDLGANNLLILGLSYYETLYAYDGQCPNCLESKNLYKAPLAFDHNGQWVKCAKCGRSYDLNNGGVVADGEGGSSLMKYHISYTGSVLNVAN